MQLPADATFSTLAATAFIAAAIGSPHCAAMCGPLVVACSKPSGLDTTPHGGSRLGGFVLQQVGRLIAYVALGAIAASCGNAIDGVVARSGARFVPLAMGSVLIALGCRELLPLARRTTPRSSGSRSAVHRIRSALSRLSASLARVFRRAPVAIRPLLLGCISILLPCGMLHAVMVGAAGARSALEGAGLLAAFYCGTLPPLILVAVGASRGTRSSLARFAAPLRGVVLIGAGIALLVLSQPGMSCCHGA